MKEIDKPIARILETYETAVYQRNITTFMHLYDPGVRVFDAWGVWSYEGADAWQIAVEGWFTSLGTEKVKVTFSDVQTLTVGSVTTLSAIVTYAGFSEQGAALHAMQNRISWVLRVVGHVLRIVHEHTSAPIGFEDSKAILSRDGTGTV